MRARDRRCRFPLCGCGRTGHRLEVSHDRHKGSGGDPSGLRSLPAGMILLCIVRHQTGSVSRHAGTLRSEPLTNVGNNGPVRWLVDVGEVGPFAVPLSAVESRGLRDYVEVAREKAVQELEPLADWQRAILNRLAEEMRR